MRTLFFIALAACLFACKPSLCECAKNKEQGENADKELTRICQDIYDSMSEEELKKANRDLAQCK